MGLCYFDADSERYQVPSLGKGTDGISGGDGLGKKGFAWVNWAIFYYCLNRFDRVSGGLTRVINSEMGGRVRVGWVDWLFDFGPCLVCWASNQIFIIRTRLVDLMTYKDQLCRY